MSNRDAYLEEFKNIDKNKFYSIAKKHLKNVKHLEVVLEDDAEYGCRWKIAWDKIKYINNLGEECSFYTSFIFVYPFDNQLIFEGEKNDISQDIFMYVKSCPHFYDAYMNNLKRYSTLENEK